MTGGSRAVPTQPGTATSVPSNRKGEHWVLGPPGRAVLLPLSRHVPRRGQPSGARSDSVCLAQGARLSQPLALSVLELGGSWVCIPPHHDMLGEVGTPRCLATAVTRT